LLDNERRDQLIEKNGNTMNQLIIRGLRFGPSGDRDSAPIDDERAVRREKFM
jgi:hypothetical protein